MNRKQLETVVLIVGVLVIAIALFLIFAGKENPANVYYTNIVFAVGFLFYIAYSTMTTSGLQKDIKALNGQIESLKGELSKSREDLKQCQSERDELEADNNKLKADKEALESSLSQIEQELEELRNQKE
jgi:septal ring factor EnvC (AmiA/AmiB activator)